MKPGAKKSIAHVDFDKADRAPLLLIAGTDDRFIPQSTVDKQCKKYGAHAGPESSKVGYKVFAGRTHGLLMQGGWEEVADYAIEWVEANLKKR